VTGADAGFGEDGFNSSEFFLIPPVCELAQASKGSFAKALLTGAGAGEGVAKDWGGLTTAGTSPGLRFMQSLQVVRPLSSASRQVGQKKRPHLWHEPTDFLSLCFSQLVSGILRLLRRSRIYYRTGS
jgi:hypothetical protein